MKSRLSIDLVLRIVASLLLAVALALSFVFYEESSLAALTQNRRLLIQSLVIVVVLTPLLVLALGALFRLFDRISAQLAPSFVPTGKDAAESKRKSHGKEPSHISHFLFQVKPFLIPFAIIVIVYLVHFAIVAPGIFSQEDTKDQLLAFFNLQNFRSDQVQLISPDVLLTNHHPVLHTVILGLCVRAGLAFGSATMGMALYTFIQVVAFTAALACVFACFERCKAPMWLRWLALCFFVLCPKLWNLSCLATKDVLFSAAVLAYLVACVDYLMGNQRRGTTLKLFMLALLVCLLRNNGVFLVAATLPFILIKAVRRRHSEKHGYAAAVSVLSAMVSYAIVIALVFPALQITGGSVRETLSVPLQQTARCLKYHYEDVTAEELAAISRVADPERMAEEYRPQLADYVKNLYRADATSEDRDAFLGAWLSLFLRHPGTCVTASVNNHYGFYCFTESGFEPRQSPTWSRDKMAIANSQIYERSGGKIDCNFSGLAPQDLVDFGTKLYECFASLPVVAQIMQAAFYFWLLMVGLVYSIGRRKPVALMVCIALLTLYAVSLLGPANAVGYTRYIAPAMVAWPLMLLGMLVPRRR